MKNITHSTLTQTRKKKPIISVHSYLEYCLGGISNSTVRSAYIHTHTHTSNEKEKLNRNIDIINQRFLQASCYGDLGAAEEAAAAAIHADST